MARATTVWNRDTQVFHKEVLLAPLDDRDEEDEGSDGVVLKDDGNDSDSSTPVASPIRKAHCEVGGGNTDPNCESFSIPDEGEFDEDENLQDDTVFYGDVDRFPEEDNLDDRSERVISDEDESETTLEGDGSLCGEETSLNPLVTDRPEVVETKESPSVATSTDIDELYLYPVKPSYPDQSSSGQSQEFDAAENIGTSVQKKQDREAEKMEKERDESGANVETNQRKRSHSVADVDEVKVKPGNLSTTSSVMDVESGSQSDKESEEESGDEPQPALADFSPRGCFIL